MDRNLVSRMLAKGSLTLMVTPFPTTHGLKFFALIHPTKIAPEYQDQTFYPLQGVREYDTPDVMAQMHRQLSPEDHSYPWFPIGIYANLTEALSAFEEKALYCVEATSLQRYSAAILNLGINYFNTDAETRKRWCTPNYDDVEGAKDISLKELFTGQAKERYRGW